MIRSREGLLQYEREHNASRAETGELKKREYKSRSYKQYYEGYSRYAVPKKNGKVRYLLLYTEDYYYLEADSQKYYGRKALYATGTVVSVIIFLICAMRGGEINSAWYVALPQAAAVVFLALTMIAMYYYVTARRLMTANGYRRASSRLVTACIGGLAAFCTGTLTAIVYLLLHLPDLRAGTLLSVAGYVADAVIMLLMLRTERSANYLRVKNETSPPEGAIFLDKVE